MDEMPYKIIVDIPGYGREVLAYSRTYPRVLRAAMLMAAGLQAGSKVIVRDTIEMEDVYTFTIGE